MMKNLKNYLTNIGTILSQLINTVVFAGNPDESVSARTYNARHNSKFWAAMFYFIEGLFFVFDMGYHCEKAHKKDIANAKKLLGIN